MLALVLADLRAAGVRRVTVGTSSSAIGPLAFYQKAGFRFWKIERDFFNPARGYLADTTENGIPVRDMVWMDQELACDAGWRGRGAIMNDMEAQVVVRRFDPAGDEESLRNCLIDQQNFHRNLEPSWPSGDAIIAEYMTYLDTECALHNGCILMAEYAGHTAGFVCVVASTRGESPEDPEPFAWIHEIYVKPAHRRRGVASVLLVEAERFARSQGARQLRLGVLDRNEHARALYASRGFREYAHVLTKALA